MKSSEHFRLTAPCGIYCGACSVYKVKDDPSCKEKLAGFGWNGVPCPGCRSVEGDCQFIDGICATFTCTAEHQVDFCYECGDFPCAKLNPVVDEAASRPHNLKLFNLCCIQKHGLDKFVETEPQAKTRYFRGKFAIGQGPQLD